MRSFLKALTFTIFSITTLVSCTKTGGKLDKAPSLKTAIGDDIPDFAPKAGEEESIDARLSRYTGQKSFLNYVPVYTAQPRDKGGLRLPNGSNERKRRWQQTN